MKFPSLGHEHTSNLVCKPVLKKFKGIPSPIARRFCSSSLMRFDFEVPVPMAPWMETMSMPPRLKLVPSSPWRNMGIHLVMSFPVEATWSHSWCSGKAALYFAQKSARTGLASFKVYPPRRWGRSLVLCNALMKSFGLIHGKSSSGEVCSMVTLTG